MVPKLSAQPDIYVDEDANSTECGSTPDGSSWECAYPALQDAFDEVNNASTSTSFEIWVAAGTYLPDNDNIDNDGDASPEHTPGNRSESFTLIRDDVEFYGGFDGTDGSGGGARETSRTQRDPRTNLVVLNGDVDNDNTQSGNSYHVLYLDGRTESGTILTDNTIIDGMTISGGRADGTAPRDRGAGIYCDGSDDGSGGADECSPVLQRLTVKSNSAIAFGGGAYIDARNGTASPLILNSKFIQNTAEDGGAIFNNGDPGTASGDLVNVAFLGNGAGGNGGGIFNDGDNGTASLRIINGTFVDNTASGGVSGGKGGSAILNRRADLEIGNTIIWGQTSFSVYDGTPSQPVIAHSVVEGGENDISGVDYRSSNLDADPRFLGVNRGAGPDDTWGTSDDNLQRNWASSAIDNGDIGVVPADVTDLDGDGNTSELIPALGLTSRNMGQTVDVGAYERGGIEPTGGVAYVNVSAAGAMNGTSWSDAYAGLQSGLRANENAQASSSPGDVDEVWVAQGTYAPTRRRDATEARSRTFYIDGDNVEAYGGFSGGESTRSARDPDANPVILSGDLDGNDDPYAPQSDTDSDAGTPSQTDHVSGSNAYSVVYLDAASANISSSTVIDGVSITGGYADGSSAPANVGGGFVCNAGSGQTCSPTLRDVTIFGNFADTHGGGLYNGGAGTSSPVLENLILRGNAAGSGGAMANEARGGTGTVNPSLTNSIIVANSSLGDGGALWNQAANSGEEASPVVTNVSIFGNSASGGGGALYGDATNGTVSPTVKNTILWGNGGEVSGSYSTLVIDHSIVEGGCPASADCSGGNVLDQNPRFADADGSDDVLGTSDDDLRLRGPAGGGNVSPAIDAGDNDAIAASLDLAGNSRKQDVAGVTDTGSPSSDAPYVDFGAYESSGDPLPVELIAFTADVTDGSALLTWTTASETNNAGFELQRKRHGTFKSMNGAFVEGAGTTAQPQNYKYRVEDLTAGTHTFRIKQVDTDGSVSYSDPIDVKIGLDGKYKLSTYPNPVQSQATLEFAVKDESDVTISVYNTLGQKVQTVYRGQTPAEETRRVQIDTNTLSSGLYFIRMNGDGLSAMKRMTVVK